ncbi:MAG TPA: SgcJ/EcaC family oxidoreductase, partial [Planctomicrobium sp.]|nr:SgcJ/EcaC family oxidoreductase [Planctomicrobium sp.]
MRPFLFAFTLGLLTAWSGGTDAAEINTQELQSTVGQAADQYSKAFKERDVQALAALFTPEGEYVDSDGVVFHGRDAIAAEYKATFEATPPGEISLAILSIRPVAAGVLVEDGISTFRSTDGEFSSQARYTATHARQADGKWLIVSVRELDVPTLTPHARLKALSWLEGAWREEVGGLTVATE